MLSPPDHYAVLGNPVEHSLSPRIHARFAQLTGQAMRYDKQLVALEQFPAHLAQFIASGALGCNITVPFKLEAFASAHSKSERAQLAQAANTLSFTQGRIAADNTDGVGLVRDIEHNIGCTLAGCDVLLIGAGGAAAGVLGPLLQAQPHRLVLVNRTDAKAQALVQRHRQAVSLQKLLQKTELYTQPIQGLEGNFDIVINASASSLSGNDVPVNSTVLSTGALAYDMMYGPKTQSFAAWSRSGGARFYDGLGMLVEQAAEAFFIWRGVRPPAAQVLRELRADLAKYG